MENGRGRKKTKTEKSIKRDSLKFAHRFHDVAKKNSPLCVGLDPSFELLSSWGLSLNQEGLKKFCDIFLKATEGLVSIIKPQAAFFEAFGPYGLFVLKDVIQRAKEQNLLVIVDGKRGDIGHSLEAYSQAWLDKKRGFGAHALTVNAYLGYETLCSLIQYADKMNAGVFVVVRSSNPEGFSVQNAKIKDQFLADFLAKKITKDNETKFSGHPVGPIGAVIGVTSRTSCDEKEHSRREKEKIKTIQLMSRSLFLVPGLGSQGGQFNDLEALFSEARQRVIPSCSRSILKEGPSLVKLRRSIQWHSEKAKNFYHSSTK